MTDVSMCSVCNVMTTRQTDSGWFTSLQCMLPSCWPAHWPSSASGTWATQQRTLGTGSPSWCSPSCRHRTLHCRHTHHVTASTKQLATALQTFTEDLCCRLVLWSPRAAMWRCSLIVRLLNISLLLLLLINSHNNSLQSSCVSVS